MRMTKKEFNAANKFRLGSPVWNGDAKRREVGLAEWRLNNNRHNAIEFTYVRKSDNKRSIPGWFYFDSNKRYQEKYQSQLLKGTKVIKIPMDHLENLELEDGDPSVIIKLQGEIKW